MRHAIHKVVSFDNMGPYELQVRFEDGVSRCIDFRPVLRGPLFGPLIDLAQFNLVQIDPEVHTLVWPNGADFDPATLYDWPELSGQLAESARRWEVPSERKMVERPSCCSLNSSPMSHLARKDDSIDEEFARIMIDVERSDWAQTALHEGWNTEEGGCI